MSADPLLPAKPSSFEDLRRLNEHSAEYWSARDVQALPDYSQWRPLEHAIRRAIASCEQSGSECDDGSGSKRQLADYHLSHFACYLPMLDIAK